MMGRVFLLAFAMLASTHAYAQYYKVSIKATGDKNINFPVAEFMMEEGSEQYKGFEARMNPAGYGALGFKPSRLLELEIKEKYEKNLQKELSRTPEEKVDEALSDLEARALNLDIFAEQQAGGGKNGNGNGRQPAKDYMKQSDAERKATAGAFRKKAEAEQARTKYEDYKSKVEKAKRNKALMKELVDEIDKKTAEQLKFKMLRDSVHQSGYPYGTFYYVAIKKAAKDQVLIDFESAVSFMSGWMPGDGNNNNNTINSSIKMEYVDMPKLEDIAIELGKAYCFQIARPVDKGGTLDEALDGTSIFARSLDPNKIAPMHKVVVDNFIANPLNENGLLSDIVKKFKGRENEVVRVVVTITK